MDRHLQVVYRIGQTISRLENPMRTTLARSAMLRAANREVSRAG